MEKIKLLGIEEEGSDFTAQELRNKLPVLLKKPKVLNKYINGKIDLDEGYQDAKISRVEERVKQAANLLKMSSNKIFHNWNKSVLMHSSKTSGSCGRKVEKIIDVVKGIDTK